MEGFRFWTSYLRALSLSFAAASAYWAVAGAFDPFGVYETRMARAFFGTPVLPAEAERVFSFVLAPFGATSLGYFVLQLFLVHVAFPRREPWAWWAVASAFAIWFVLDTALSLAHGARFNVALANLPALVAMAPGLVGTWRGVHARLGGALR